MSIILPQKSWFFEKEKTEQVVWKWLSERSGGQRLCSDTGLYDDKGAEENQESMEGEGSRSWWVTW